MQDSNHTPPLAEVSDLVAAYDDQIILDHVNLSIKPGEILCVIGGSGSGKTTLLKHFIGLLKPVEGTVSLFGQDWWLQDERERESSMRRVGVLFQNGALLGSKDIATNVAVPLEQHTKLPDRVIVRVVDMKLQQVGLLNARYKLPAELSGGMRKRASLARALVLDPPLVFCDEPSAGLDPSTTYQLDQLLLGLRDELGIALVVVTHETASIRRIADRVAYLEKGKLIFVDTLDKALNSEITSVRRFFEMSMLK